MSMNHQFSSQKPECSICLTNSNQLKSLTCSHTFCKDCLKCILQTQTNQSAVSCPVCTKGTSVTNGDVDKLQTIVTPSSVVEEVKTKIPTCSVCDAEVNPPAVSYCQDCGENMCKSCEKDHSSWKRFSKHSVVAVSEVVSGKVQYKRRRKCKKHPNEDDECFCRACREFVCFRCGMLEHSQEGHTVVEASKHEETLMENIKDIEKRAESKKVAGKKHIEFIETQRKEIASVMTKVNEDIDNTYNEYINFLSERREALKCKLKELSEKLQKELLDMIEESRRAISQMSAAEKLVANGTKVSLEKDALIAHGTLCKRLERILGRNNPDEQAPRGVVERARKITFRKYEGAHELSLGEVEGYRDTLNLKADVELPRDCCIKCVTRVPSGEMAVGLWGGGIQLYSPDGELQQTVLNDSNILDIRFLSDCRSVAYDADNKVSLYTPQWEKLDVEFKTMSNAEGWIGCLTVDGCDNIYVGYVDHGTIEVFSPQGGAAVRKIMCDGYTPWQLFSFQSTENLILKDKRHVIRLDGEGKKANVLEKNTAFAFPAVCRDDLVIVASVKDDDGLVSIDQYTSDFEHVKNLISDFKICQPKRNWYYLQEFESGEIALCTSERLYIFHAV
ncbi:E3 ubiquitin-protein ligase TRIM45-like [Diadema setosum]|uniref:E3 ubiquitin-protein ligase TRIM45-like n=1 Tax=Diadema setosum TaxID=31175 RepID=UPI003B3A414E